MILIHLNCNICRQSILLYHKPLYIFEVSDDVLESNSDDIIEQKPSIQEWVEQHVKSCGASKKENEDQFRVSEYKQPKPVPPPTIFGIPIYVMSNLKGNQAYLVEKKKTDMELFGFPVLQTSSRKIEPNDGFTSGNPTPGNTVEDGLKIVEHIIKMRNGFADKDLKADSVLVSQEMMALLEKMMDRNRYNLFNPLGKKEGENENL